MNVTEFVLARIAEREAVARAATIPAHHGYAPHGELAEWAYEPGGEVFYVNGMQPAQNTETFYVTADSEGLISAIRDDCGPHVALNDPAHVLAQCEAIRKIAEKYRQLGSEPFSEHCKWADGAVIFLRAVETALRTLALPDADHPDYDESWRP